MMQLETNKGVFHIHHDSYDDSYPTGELWLKDPRDFGTIKAVTIFVVTEVELLKYFLILDSLLIREGALNYPKITIPYFPGARSDRTLAWEEGNDQVDRLISSPILMAWLGVLSRTAEIVVADIHNPRVLELRENTTNLSVGDILVMHKEHFQGKYDGIIKPDDGAHQRAAEASMVLGIPFYPAWKVRDIETGKISGFGISEVLPHAGRFLIVDDIIDGGGTFIGIADAIQSTRPDVVLDMYATHGLFTKPWNEDGQFNKTYVTDSIYSPWYPGQATVLPTFERKETSYAS